MAQVLGCGPRGSHGSSAGRIWPLLKEHVGFRARHASGSLVLVQDQSMAGSPARLGFSGGAFKALAPRRNWCRAEIPPWAMTRLGYPLRPRAAVQVPGWPDSMHPLCQGGHRWPKTQLNIQDGGWIRCWPTGAAGCDKCRSSVWFRDFRRVFGAGPAGSCPARTAGGAARRCAPWIRSRKSWPDARHA